MTDIMGIIVGIIGDRNPFDCLDEWKHLIPELANKDRISIFLLTAMENVRLKEQVKTLQGRIASLIDANPLSDSYVAPERGHDD